MRHCQACSSHPELCEQQLSLTDMASMPQLDADALLKSLRKDATKHKWVASLDSNTEAQGSKKQGEPKGVVIRLPNFKLPQPPKLPSIQWPQLPNLRPQEAFKKLNNDKTSAGEEINS